MDEVVGSNPVKSFVLILFLAKMWNAMTATLVTRKASNYESRPSPPVKMLAPQKGGSGEEKRERR